MWKKVIEKSIHTILVKNLLKMSLLEKDNIFLKQKHANASAVTAVCSSFGFSLKYCRNISAPLEKNCSFSHQCAFWTLGHT